MKICPSCERTYSDTLTQCPVCGIDLNACASGSTDTEHSQTHSDVATHTQKTADTKEKKNGWMTAFLVLLVFMLAFVGNFAIQVSKYKDLESSYNWKKREYNSLEKEYKKLEEMISLYDLEGKYGIDVTDVYNGTEDYEKKSSELDHKNLDRICIKWTIYDNTKVWGDVLYMDVLNPDGEICYLNPENDNHTWKIDLSNCTTEKVTYWVPFRMNIWKSGTYWVIFYQGSRAIDSFEMKVN